MGKFREIGREFTAPPRSAKLSVAASGGFGSLGYNNVDFFSPEMAYQVEDVAELTRYLGEVNARLAEKGTPPLTADQLLPGPNQLRASIMGTEGVPHGLAARTDTIACSTTTAITW